MNKGELIEAIVKDTKLPKAAAGKALDSVIGNIGKALKKGDSVVVAGFGSFKVSKRKARTGRNPQTGEKIRIKASKVPTFKAGVGLKKAVK